jgi:hypothetical protein
MMHLKVLANQEQTTSKISRKKERIKIRSEIKEMKAKKYKGSMKQRVGSLRDKHD